MNNTIITSISALVFLVIGLFIGKSNKQIEIQTVVKTNIVEKPIEKIVEKIVEKQIYKNDALYKYLATDEFPSNLKSINISVFIDDTIKNSISKEEIETKIELELRRVGINIETTTAKSDAQLRYVLNAIDLENGSYVLDMKLDILRYISFTLKDEKYTKRTAIWSSFYFGMAPAKTLNNNISTTLAKQMDELSNSILKSK